MLLATRTLGTPVATANRDGAEEDEDEDADENAT
jgi:hypothetical protein